LSIVNNPAVAGYLFYDEAAFAYNVPSRAPKFRQQLYRGPTKRSSRSRSGRRRSESRRRIRRSGARRPPQLGDGGQPFVNRFLSELPWALKSLTKR
jgi:hypothetical protein